METTPIGIFCSDAYKGIRQVLETDEPMQIIDGAQSAVLVSYAQYDRLLQTVRVLEGEKQAIVYTPERLKEIVSPICEEYGIKRMSVFGSVARGEATEDSDVDLLADIPQGWSYFSIISFREMLEEMLKRKVDLVTEGIDNKRFLERIRKDEVLLYERQG